MQALRAYCICEGSHCSYHCCLPPPRLGRGSTPWCPTLIALLVLLVCSCVFCMKMGNVHGEFRKIWLQMLLVTRSHSWVEAHCARRVSTTPLHAQLCMCLKPLGSLTSRHNDNAGRIWTRIEIDLLAACEDVVRPSFVSSHRVSRVCLLPWSPATYASITQRAGMIESNGFGSLERPDRPSIRRLHVAIASAVRVSGRPRYPYVHWYRLTYYLASS